MEPETVEEPCCSMDLLPTLSNLFGLEFDSRLFIGTDILSDTDPIVCFQDRSFICSRFMYDNTNQKIIQRSRRELDPLEVARYIDMVKDKFYYSAKIINTDYYGYLFGRKSINAGDYVAETRSSE